MIAIVKKVVMLSLCLAAGCALAVKASAQPGFYAGVLGGYGSTNWSMIDTTSPTLQASLPAKAHDGGFDWGVFAGINFKKYFGAEVRYQKFATTKLNFAQFNEYSTPPNFPAFKMTSATDTIMLLGKLRVPVSQRFELYSVLGGAVTTRKDQLANISGFGGVFGAGVYVQIVKHFSSSVEFDFVTGKAAINLRPAANYVPFLTSINCKLIYNV